MDEAAYRAEGDRLRRRRGPLPGGLPFRAVDGAAVGGRSLDHSRANKTGNRKEARDRAPERDQTTARGGMAALGAAASIHERFTAGGVRHRIKGVMGKCIL